MTLLEKCNQNQNNQHIEEIKWVSGSQLYLQDLKSRIEKSKEKIDKVDPKIWHYYRKNLNDYDFCSRMHGVNRAFFKLWEMLHNFPTLISASTSRSLQLAECPGSFVQVIHKLLPSCKMVAVSKPLSLYSEVLVNSKTIPKFSPLVTKIDQCQFIYLNLLNMTLLSKFVSVHNDFDFITCDGGIDEGEQYNKKEELHLDLILAEIITILMTLKVSGNCLIKVFDIFSETMVHILWLLAKHFETFTFYKPETSRPTNSEKYFICFGFKGNIFHSKESLFSLFDNTLDVNLKTNQIVPSEFYDQTLNFTNTFGNIQIQNIDHVLNSIQSKVLDNEYFMNNLIRNKKQVFRNWVHQYRLPKR